MRDQAVARSTEPLRVNAPERAARGGVEWLTEPLPVALGSQIEQKFANVFMTLGYLRAANPNAALEAFLHHGRCGEPDVFVFARCGRRLEVFCTAAELQTAQAIDFCRRAFERFVEVEIITFRHVHAVPAAVRACVAEAGLFAQTSPVGEDFVAQLPATAAAFDQSLARNTRKNLRQSLKAIQAAHPSFSFDVEERSAIAPETIDRLVELHHRRMRSAGRRSGIDGPYVERIRKLMQTYGLVGVARINGQIVGGSINYVVASANYSEMVAHDNEFNAYSLGYLCSYLTLREGMARGISRWHFLWGNFEYKRRLQGRPRQLLTICVYRTRGAAVRNMTTVITNLVRARQQALRSYACPPLLKQKWRKLREFARS